MGLFDRAKNFVSGGHCTVTLEKPAIGFPGMPISVKVKAVAKQEFECSAAYIDIGATEIVTVRPDGAAADVIKTNATYSNQQKISDGFKMKEGETKEWTVVVTLPKETQPTFVGKFSKHVIQMQGRLDTKGNDPDSGWSDIKIGAMS